MYEIHTGPDRVMIVGVQSRNYDDLKFTEMMEEMEALAKTAGGEIISVQTQKMESVHQKTAVGSGKLEELKLLVQAKEIDLVIFFNALSPAMLRNIEEALGVRVIDRIQLILDIFALRAKSREGKLQVSLAQYEYLLPRIWGQGKNLSRLAGGIGTRGPGESKLETDRRHIRTMMNQTKKELNTLGQHRERTRSRRKAGYEYNIGLIGYTNAGKSTLLQGLSHQETYVQDQLFATLDPLTRRIAIKGQELFTLTDTVGFIEELPTTLIQAFKSTLEELTSMDLILHVVDASHPARLMHEETVLHLLKELKADHLPILTVYNKMDLASTNFNPSLNPHICISAMKEDDLERLKEAVWESCIRISQSYSLKIPADQAGLVNKIRQETLVQALSFDEENQYYLIDGYSRQSIG